MCHILSTSFTTQAEAHHQQSTRPTPPWNPWCMMIMDSNEPNNCLEGTLSTIVFTLYCLGYYAFGSSGGCVFLVSYAEMPSDRDPRRLHLQNVAHLYSITNDVKQRKSIEAAELAQQSWRMPSNPLISYTSSRRSIPQGLAIPCFRFLYSYERAPLQEIHRQIRAISAVQPRPLTQ